MTSKEKKRLEEKIYAGERINSQEALKLFSWELLELGQLANERRRGIYPEETVGFILDRIINFTNRCEAMCRFCAYHARAGLIEPYELDIDKILEKIDALVAIGGTQVMLQGGLHPDYSIDDYITMIAAIKERFPDIYLHSLSPAEIVHISKKSKLDLRKVIEMLKHAGLNSVPGASDLLVDRIRGHVSPGKLTKDEWCNVMYALYSNGMGSTATMTYGMGETIEERIEHLNVVRSVQDSTKY